jgi:glycosyltransferase involved in cell wall biosynthesis
VSWTAPLELATQVLEKRRLLARLGANIVHMNEPGWNSDIVLAARLARIPVALHLHNPQSVSRRNLNYSIAKKVFLCSAGQIEVIENSELIRDKLTVLHNAVDVEAFSRGRSIREKLGLPESAVVIGTVAQIGYRKGIDLFLDAAEQLLDRHPQLKFVVVGPQASNEESYFLTMMERMQHGRLKTGVVYLGGRTDIPDVLSSFDVFFLPTRAEPFGMVIIEAMAAGVPVVATHVGGIPEIITSRELGRTVREPTAEAYAGVIDELVEMGDSHRRGLGERGRMSLAGRFDLPSMGNALKTVYEKLVAPDRA